MVVVADVAGKGLASALVGSSFRAALRAMANSEMPLVDMATNINLLHYKEGEESRRRYVTAMFLRLDPKTHTVEVVNAGHNPAFLLNGSDVPELIEASGTPVGMLPFSDYTAEKYVLSDKAKLLIYTDGMTEVFKGNEEFGQDRLMEAFRASRHTDATGTLNSIWQTLEAFSNQENQSDDMTALVIGRKP
jgi:serine phosphatase RsbU (regulator of sigma subunit)